MIELVICLVIGFCLGIIAGIVPGMHINLLSITILGLSGVLSGYLSALGLAVMIITMAIVANFFEFVKAIFMNMPDEGNVLAVHPISRLVSEGRGVEVIKLVSIGCLGSLLLSVSLFPLMVWFVPVIYYGLRPFISVLLISISLHLILKERMNAKYAAAVFGISGIMGYIVLNAGMNEPLLPMLTGLFGFGILLRSMTAKYPEQKRFAVSVKRRQSLYGIISGFVAASILSFIPAIGPTQASILSAELKRHDDEKGFLISVAGVNTGDIIFSLLALYTINKPRSGAIAAIQQILTVDGYVLFVLLLSAVIAGILGFLAMRLIGVWLCKHMHKLNHRVISYAVMAFVSVMVLLFDGAIGLLVLATATAIGLYANNKHIAMSHAMGCLILPTIIYFI